MKNIFLQVMVLIIAIVITGCVSDTKGENSSTNPTGLSIEKEMVELNIGETTTPAIIFLPADATNKNVNWTSSNTSTAVVVEGKITAIGEGETIITASTVDGKYYDSVTIKVRKVLEVTGLKVDQKLLELKAGEITTVSVTVIPSNATDKSLSWSSSNNSVATVVNGIITAVGKGEAVITVATSAGKFPKVINVKVTQTSITTGSAVITTNQAFIATEILGKPTNQSVAISVIPAKKMELYFEYGTESGKFTERTSTSAVEAGIPVEVVIDKLKSNTTYYYQMRYHEIGANSFETGKENRFVTQRNVGNTFVFTVQADPHRDENTSLELYMKTLQNVAKDKSDFHIDLGDTFMTEKFAKTEKEVVQRYIEERSYFGVIGSSIPLFLVNGNHEGENGWMLNGGAENLAVWASNARNKYYVNPKPDTFYSGNISNEKFVGQRGGYYSWEWGDALFVVLDPFWYSTKKSTSLETNWNYTLGKVQYDWFKGVLENSKAKYKFVFAHNLVGGADTFMPPGKVADYFGFQYMRDVDIAGHGHNSSFLTIAANNVLYILNDGQKAKLISLAKEQAPLYVNFAYNRFLIMDAFRRNLEGKIPAGSKGLSIQAVSEYTGGLYKIDADLSYNRAKVVGEIIASFTAEQKAYLAKMEFNNFSTWPDIPENEKIKRGMNNNQYIALMTYASELFSWYRGNLDADVYFCPERHGTYFGGFFMKDYPAMNNPKYFISTALTGDSGKEFLSILNGEQRALIAGIVTEQKAALTEIAQIRLSISNELRKAISGGVIDKDKVYSLIKRYGVLDGQISALYAVRFSAVNKTLTEAQKADLKKLRNLDVVPNGAYRFSTPVAMPEIANTDFMFGIGTVPVNAGQTTAPVAFGAEMPPKR